MTIKAPCLKDSYLPIKKIRFWIIFFTPLLKELNLFDFVQIWVGYYVFLGRWNNGGRETPDVWLATFDLLLITSRVPSTRVDTMKRTTSSSRIVTPTTNCTRPIEIRSSGFPENIYIEFLEFSLIAIIINCTLFGR